MKPVESKQLCTDIINRLISMYSNEDVFETDFYDQLIVDVEKLYHKDMVQLKVDMDMYKDYHKEHKCIPAGSWVYIDQDEGGCWLNDEAREFFCEIDYTVPLSEVIVFYE